MKGRASTVEGSDGASHYKKHFKHGQGSVRRYLKKAHNSFLKGVVHGSALLWWMQDLFIGKEFKR